MLDDNIDIKSLTDSLRDRLGVMEDLKSMLYAPTISFDQSLKAINFYNMVKKVLIRSGSPDRRLNLRVFTDLLRELRVKLEIAKAGITPEKVKS